MEGWLSHLALGAVSSAFAGDHALAQQHFCALDGALLDEVVVLDDEHFADVVRMIEEDDVMPGDFVMCDVAIVPRQLLEEQDRIGGRTQFAQNEPEKSFLSSRREVVTPSRARNINRFGPRSPLQASLTRGA